MLISVDFDGTCVSHEFPHIGKNIGAEIVLKALSDAGHDIICMTMRSPKDKESYRRMHESGGESGRRFNGITGDGRRGYGLYG